MHFEPVISKLRESTGNWLAQLGRADAPLATHSRWCLASRIRTFNGLLSLICAIECDDYALKLCNHLGTFANHKLPCSATVAYSLTLDRCTMAFGPSTIQHITCKMHHYGSHTCCAAQSAVSNGVPSCDRCLDKLPALARETAIIIARTARPTCACSGAIRSLESECPPRIAGHAQLRDVTFLSASVNRAFPALNEKCFRARVFDSLRSHLAPINATIARTLSWTHPMCLPAAHAAPHGRPRSSTFPRAHAPPAVRPHGLSAACALETACHDRGVRSAAGARRPCLRQ
eukprot:366436-Chlamydomonas_euryale.AAC.19